MGASVAEIVNRPHEAGNHRLTYSPDECSFKRGVYFVKVKVGGDSAAFRKVIRVIYIR